MTNANERYLSLPKGRNKWIYQRSIPADMQKYHGGKKLLVRSTGTTIRAQAIRIRDQWAESDDGFWAAMRSGTGNNTTREKYEAALDISKHIGSSFDDPDNLGEAIETGKVDEFFRNDKAIKKITGGAAAVKTAAERQEIIDAHEGIKTLAIGNVDKPVENTEEAKARWLNDVIADEWVGKSREQKRNFMVPVNRAVSNFDKVVNPTGAFLKTSRSDALRFHAWLNGRVTSREISPSTANRDMGVLRRLFRDLAHRDQVLDQNPFDGLTWRKPRANKASVATKIRKPFSTDWIVSKFLNADSLRGLNAEARAVIYILTESGARPSEIINLLPENIHLDANIPFFEVKAVEGREIKTAASARQVPLVGVALEAMRLFPQGFERYRDKDSGFSQVAMKYLRSHQLMESEDNYVYSFRHSYIDRLRETDAVRDLRESIVGHNEGGSHGDYGSGFSLARKLEVMQSIALPYNPEILR